MDDSQNPKTELEKIAVGLPTERPRFGRDNVNRIGRKSVWSFDDWFAKEYEYDSPEIQADLKREATAILSQAMAGKQIPPKVYRAAEVIVTRGVFPEKKAPESVHFHVTPYAVAEAKKRAGLPSE